MTKRSILSRDNLLYWLSFCLGLINCIQAQTCKPIDQCSCMTSDGKIISLWDIDKRYTLISDDPSHTYLYRPCLGLDEPNSDCNGALGCQVGQNEKTAFAYKPKYVTTGIDHGSDLYKFTYKGGKDTQSGINFSFDLLLVCDATKDAEFLTMLGCQFGTCVLQLTSKCACPGHCNFPNPPSPGKRSSPSLSIGSILCITLLVLVLIYTIAGVAINTLALDKEGSEVIPHKTFWSDMPSLVKDGVIFSCQRVRVGIMVSCDIVCGGTGDYEKI